MENAESEVPDNSAASADNTQQPKPSTQAPKTPTGLFGRLRGFTSTISNLAGFSKSKEAEPAPLEVHTAPRPVRRAARIPGNRPKPAPQTERKRTWSDRHAAETSPLLQRNTMTDLLTPTPSSPADQQIKAAATSRQTRRERVAALRAKRAAAVAAAAQAVPAAEDGPRKRHQTGMPGEWTEEVEETEVDDDDDYPPLGMWNGRNIITYGTYDERKPEERLPRIPNRCFTYAYQMDPNGDRGPGHMKRQLALDVNDGFTRAPDERLAAFVWKWGADKERFDINIVPWMKWVKDDLKTWKRWLPGMESFEQFEPAPRERMFRQFHADKMGERGFEVGEEDFTRWANNAAARAAALKPPAAKTTSSGTYGLLDSDEESEESSVYSVQSNGRTYGLLDSDSDEEDTTVVDASEQDVPSKPPPRPTPAHASLPPPAVTEDTSIQQAPQTPAPANPGNAALDRARATAQKFKPTTSSRLARVSPEAPSPEERGQATKTNKTDKSAVMFSAPAVGLSKLTEGAPTQLRKSPASAPATPRELTQEEMDEVDAEVMALGNDLRNPNVILTGRGPAADEDADPEVDAEVTKYFEIHGEAEKAHRARLFAMAH